MASSGDDHRPAPGKDSVRLVVGAAVIAWLVAWFAAAPFAAWFALDLPGLEPGGHQDPGHRHLRHVVTIGILCIGYLFNALIA